VYGFRNLIAEREGVVPTSEEGDIHQVRSAVNLIGQIGNVNYGRNEIESDRQQYASMRHYECERHVIDKPENFAAEASLNSRFNNYVVLVNIGSHQG
jgi:hypothetical protein